MTAPGNRPLDRRIQARVMRVMNVPMRAILGLPFPTPLGRRLMLLFLTGRKTGRRYRQPVSYVRDGDTLLTPGGGNWKLIDVAQTEFTPEGPRVEHLPSVEWRSAVNPGMLDVLIVAPERLAETRPDYIVILPWNLRAEIVHQLGYAREWGAKFVVPIPKLEVI